MSAANPDIRTLPRSIVGRSEPSEPLCTCPGCDVRARAQPLDQRRIGELRVDEFVAVVCARWRRRAGRRSRRHEHAGPFIRALTEYILAPTSPDRAVGLEKELELEMARLRAEGLNRPQAGRELQRLSGILAEILAHSGLEPATAAAMIETIDRWLLSTTPWRRPVAASGRALVSA